MIGESRQTDGVAMGSPLSPVTAKWRIKLNETKSTYINFTNQKIDQFFLMALGYHLQIQKSTSE
jgi:hypothetical protein